METTAKFIPVASAADIRPGQIKAFRVDGHNIILVNQGGTFFATQDVCTHDGGPLADGELDGFEIECPRHGARFDLRTGKVMALPAMFPIKTFPVRVEGDRILVAVE